MRLRIFVLVVAAVGVPALLAGETLYLVDGSTLKGKVIRYVNDTLYFETGFGTTVAVPKDGIERIDFIPGASKRTPGVGRVDPAFEEAAAGTLRVVFEDVGFTSRISVERGKHRDAIERENSIEQALFVGDHKIYSHVDSTTDKVIRNGPETILRNDFEAKDFEVVMEPGHVHLELVFGTLLADQYVGRFASGPLERQLLIDNVAIEPGATTRIRVGMKRKKLGLGKSELQVMK